jgi:hypothetical protein
MGLASVGWTVVTRLAAFGGAARPDRAAQSSVNSRDGQPIASSWQPVLEVRRLQEAREADPMVRDLAGASSD